MKKIFVSGIIIIAVMLVLPLAAADTVTEISHVGTRPSEITRAEEKTPTSEALPTDKTVFKILDTDAEKVSELSREDYIFGVLAAEMPALYETEALKAQAVAAYTFALYRSASNEGKGYDITDDYTIDQAFITEKAAREKWGSNAEEYVLKLKNAVKEVEGLKITYGGKPILAVYHAISSGKTESCKNVWGSDIPYLVSVDSHFDKLSPDYISTVTLSAEELKNALSGKFTPSGEVKSYFGNFEKTESGTVKNVTVCGSKIKGSVIREALNLRSSCFDVSYRDGSFVFTVYGYGHGVGMSQYGADYSAKQGKNYKEILLSYYKGCRIE